MNRQNGASRPYDVVLFGATGFVGELTAGYLAAHAPDGCRWALAGRNRAKLEQLRNRLTALHPHCADLPLLHADAADADALRELARSTHVVATTVGPYVWYGEKLVAACAGGNGLHRSRGRAGVRRPDVPGARRPGAETGARILHACGFDSVPHDLGAYFTVLQLPEDVPLRIDGFVRSNAVFSGGTFASALNTMGRGPQMLSAAEGAGCTSPGWSAAAPPPRSAGRASARRPAPGRFRCRPSTRRSSDARPVRSPATAPTSATGTTPRSNICRWPWAARRPWAPCSARRSCRPYGTG